MSKNRLHKWGYNALRIFHWSLFFVMLEILFICAGWMILGGIGMILDGVIGSPEQQSNQEFFRFFGLIGKAVGVVAGIVATRFVLGRYTNPNPR